MRNLFSIIALTLINFLSIPAFATSIVVDYRDGISEADALSISAREGLTNEHVNSLEFPRSGLVIGDVEPTQVDFVIARLRRNPNVQAVEINTEMRGLFRPNDQRYAEQWGFERIHMEQAWGGSSSAETCGAGVVAAVVDTGVTCTVSDMQGTTCQTGYNFVSDNQNARDDHGHGTHVAGTIAQTTNNTVGVAGIAHCATILPVKVLDRNGSGTLSDVADGIRWAAEQPGVRLMNLSLGGSGHSQVMANAVRYARDRGVLVICAAGNDGGPVGSPANEEGAFAVAALDQDGTPAWFTSHGREIQIIAPGVNILQQTICENGRNNCEQFASWSGTSMATPHVAGVAALLFGLGLGPDQVEATLRSSAHRPEGEFDRNYYGNGVLDAGAAVNASRSSRGGGGRSIIYLGLAFLLVYGATIAWRKFTSST